MSEIRSQATAARNELERSAIGWQQYISRALGCKPGQLTYQLEECIEKIEALKPRTVNSIEDLRELPVGSVVKSKIAVYQKFRTWWAISGDPREFPVQSIPLPATVLFTPGDAGWVK